MLSSLSYVLFFSSGCLTHVYSSRTTCGVVDGVQNTYSVSNVDDWTRCYFVPYSNATNMETLISNCGSSALYGENTYMFVGAMYTSSALTFHVGAYAPAATLATYTLFTAAVLPSTWPNISVYWYNYPFRSFGFADGENIAIDYSVYGYGDRESTSSDTRLSWSTNGIGGYRAGSFIDLENGEIWYKALYIKDCSPSEPTEQTTTSPTAVPSEQPTSLTIVPTSYPTVQPSQEPTTDPSLPTNSPTKYPSIQPTIPTTNPTNIPSVEPTNIPTINPTLASAIANTVLITEAQALYGLIIALVAFIVCVAICYFFISKKSTQSQKIFPNDDNVGGFVDEDGRAEGKQSIIARLEKSGEISGNVVKLQIAKDNLMKEMMQMQETQKLKSKDLMMGLDYNGLGRSGTPEPGGNKGIILQSLSIQEANSLYVDDEYGNSVMNTLK